MAAVSAMLPHCFVALSNKAAVGKITAAQNIAFFDISDLTQIHMTSLLCMLSSIGLTATYPATARHIAFEDQAFCISVVMHRMKLLHKRLGLFQYVRIMCWPDSSIHLWRQ